MKEVRWEGRILGYQLGKTIMIYKHDGQMLNKFKSFGVSENALNMLEELGFKTIIFNYSGTLGKIKFISSVSDFRRSPLFHDNYGDSQRHVSIEDMTAIEVDKIEKIDDLPITKEWIEDQINGVEKELSKMMPSGKRMRLEAYKLKLNNMKKFGRLR